MSKHRTGVEVPITDKYIRHISKELTTHDVFCGDDNNNSGADTCVEQIAQLRLASLREIHRKVCFVSICNFFIKYCYCNFFQKFLFSYNKVQKL